MLKNIKFYFENLFATKWTETSIHFAGQEFDPQALGISSWVNPYYTPTRRRNFGLGGGGKIYYGDLYITCWDDNDVKVMELGDKIADFIDSSVDRGLFKLQGYDVVDHGWDTTNKAFVLLSFKFETIRGTCGATPSPTTRTPVVNANNNVVNNTIPIVN